MKYLVIAICIIIIALALYIVIKDIITQTKGQCSGKCKGCPQSGKCNIDNNKNK
jgi:hypothetical protein